MKTVQYLIAIGLTFVMCSGLAWNASAAGIDNSNSVVSGGMSHTLAVMSDGSVWAWGSNESGQLGQSSDMAEAKEPVKIKGISAVAVAAGFNFSAALDEKGFIYTWGGKEMIPTQVSSLRGVRAIAAGQTDLLALKYDGTVWQWTVGAGNEPQQVSGLQKIMAVATGGGHFLALSISGQVWAWGLNDKGQLGVGDTSDRTTPLQIDQLSDIVDIAGGYSHSLAVTYDGTVYAWGSNTNGELGNGTTESSTIPVEVKNLSDVQQVSAGINTSIAVTEDGKLYTWGYGEYGQLGSSNTDITQTEPVVVNGSSFGTPVFIASGLYHNLMVNSEGKLYTWGRNKNGQLGTGENVNGTSPKCVAALSLASTYSAGNYEMSNLQGLHSWSVAEVKSLYESDMVSPRLWSDFDKSITRAEFAHLLVNVYENVKGITVSVDMTAQVQDVDSHALKQDILKAYQLGFINGRSYTVFAPDDSITREEAAKMLCSFLANTRNIAISPKSTSLEYYSDADTIGEWAVPYVAYSYENNIMKGSGGKFDPKGKFTREQSLLTMARLVEHNGWDS